MPAPWRKAREGHLDNQPDPARREVCYTPASQGCCAATAQPSRTLSPRARRTTVDTNCLSLASLLPCNRAARVPPASARHAGNACCFVTSVVAADRRCPLPGPWSALASARRLRQIFHHRLRRKQRHTIRTEFGYNQTVIRSTRTEFGYNQTHTRRRRTCCGIRMISKGANLRSDDIPPSQKRTISLVVDVRVDTSTPTLTMRRRIKEGTGVFAVARFAGSGPRPA